MTYNPQVNDYVIWERPNGLKDEGWIYFISTEIEQKRGFPKHTRYLTIEVGVREKPICEYEKNNPHKYIHILLLCYQPQWNELTFVKRRKSQKDSSILLDSSQHIYYNEAKQNTHRGQ